MDIQYFPNQGIVLNSTRLTWKESRTSVREKLGQIHIEDDKIIEMAQHFDGDENQNINQKRDVYVDAFSKGDKLFLNYDKANSLHSIEVYAGYAIIVENFRLVLGQELSPLIEEFTRKGISWLEPLAGSYIFPQLKMILADPVSLGLEGTAFSYFYAASEMSHLIEEEE